MRIGYACIPLCIDAKTTRTFLLKNFSEENLISTAGENIADLKRILQYNLQNNIRLFRISSDIIPFGSHEINNIEWWRIFKSELSEIGEFIKKNEMRVSMHPGQYTVINSDSDMVVEKSIKDLEYHSRFMDSMELDYSNKIVLHVGGVYGDRALAVERFEDSFERLSASVKKRLAIENDEKSYNIKEVLRLCNKVKVPAVFDILHHFFNPSLNNDIELILSQVRETWKSEDGNMKLHYSNQSQDKKFGAHSKWVDTESFINFYEKVKTFNPDIMLEVKDKDISALKCINCTSRQMKPSMIYEQWEKYKYSVMEKDYGLYKQYSSMVKEGCSVLEFYKFIDRTLSKPFDADSYKNTLLHVWEYFKGKASEAEKNSFFKKLEAGEYEKSKLVLQRLTNKYNEKYIKESYYFKY